MKMKITIFNFSGNQWNAFPTLQSNIYCLIEDVIFIKKSDYNYLYKMTG